MAKKRILIELDENDYQIIAENAAVTGDSFIASLRQIIREWARTAPTNGKVITICGNEPQN